MTLTTLTQVAGIVVLVVISATIILFLGRQG